MQTKVLLLTAVLATQLPLDVLACDACNLGFAGQVANERADSPIGRDLKRAMLNQRGLKLDGYSDEKIMAAQMAMIDKKSGSDKTGSGKSPQTENTTASETAVGECCGQPDCESLKTPSTTAAAETSATAFALAAATTAEAMQGEPASLLTSTDSLPALPAGDTLSPVSVGRELPDYMANADFIEILERDYKLPTTPYSTVPQDAPVDKSFTVRMSEGKTYIGNGVVYDGFLMDGKVPGPTVVVDEGDVVEMSFVNEGTIPHGASIHAAYTQTSKYVGKIGAGETKSVRFRAMTPGVYMYHCAPGGHAIGMHVIGGQYGMVLVRPKDDSYQLEKELGHKPNLELFLIQHELYASGRDSIYGQPEYVLFNGHTFRYVEEPIMAKPGDYVRINFLNVGPNILSTFHIVGIIWDYVYWQGNPAAKLPGGQTVTAGPSDSFVIEFRMPPDEGAYTMLTHAVGSTNRGAIGLIVVDDEADLEEHRTILPDGKSYNEAEMRGYTADATRIVAPFGIGNLPVDRPVVYGPETDEVHISIIGNSYYPKVVQVAPGTKVTWTNEDVFTYLAGEYAGIHNAASVTRPEDSDGFSGELLAHGESWSHTFDDTEFAYEYECTPHPYMRGKVIVKAPDYSLAGAGADGGGSGKLSIWVLPLIGLCLLLSTGALVIRSQKKG